MRLSAGTGSVLSMNNLDTAKFKEVVGHFVTGVVVVTAQSPQGLAGFTCQSFGSLSLEPTLVSFGASAASQSWPKVRSSPTVGINILASDQEDLARVFATSGVDKFEGVTWTPGIGGAPMIVGALAFLEGRVVAVSTHGDHDLVVVEVDQYEHFAGSPLVYYRGGYGFRD